MNSNNAFEFSELERAMKYLETFKETLEVVDSVIFPNSYLFDRLQAISGLAKECERLIALKSGK